MTKNEIVSELVKLYADPQMPNSVAANIFAFRFGDEVIGRYTANELISAAHVEDASIDENDDAELNAAFLMYKYFKKNPALLDGIKNESMPPPVVDSVLQRIVYGAPGTGKSWGIEEVIKHMPENVIRTTFHPDSDYSTFVGSYKPTVEEIDRTYVDSHGIENEVKRKDGSTATEKKIIYRFVEQAFTKAYIKAWKALARSGGTGESDDDYPKSEYKGSVKVMVDAVRTLIQEHGGQPGFEMSYGEIVDKVVEIDPEYARGGIIPSDYCYNRTNAGTYFSRPALFVYMGNNRYRCDGDGGTYTGPIMARPVGSSQDKIVGQCTNGKRRLNGGDAEKIYLVIEEINRGNCAQAFGDLFQLLDRDKGFSKYTVKADEDLRRHLATAFKDIDLGDRFKNIQSGDDLLLPPNLYIWATMNTSDQSLFPMDSAFKRRWDWKYVPIVEGKDKNGNKLGWSIEVKAEGAGKTRNWWDFIRRINIIIGNVTQSEDKKLGYFFAKPKDGGTVIGEETFVNKVVFYIWNEVLKDCPEDDENIADLQLDFDGTKRLPKFVDFFDVENNGEINSMRVKQLLDAVEKVELPQKQEKQSAATASPGAN